MILISPDGTTAFNSESFHHAYIHDDDLCDCVALKIILNDGQKVWWDSSPLVCEPARDDMKASLKALVASLENVLLCLDGMSAFNVGVFSHAYIKAAKEVFMWYIAVYLNDKTELWWDGIPMDNSEDGLKPVLVDLMNALNEE